MKKIHKLLGVIMLAPLLLWGLTGIVFLTKPGYDAAYDRPSLTLYPLETLPTMPETVTWSEAKLSRSILGVHLLVLENDRWIQLDPATLETMPLPSSGDIEALIKDAIKSETDRYGSIVAVEDTRITTDTGVVLTLDWNTLSLTQKGPDTRLINTLYSIHYLQWTPSPVFNTVLGALGIVLLLALALAGLSLLTLGWRQEPR